MNNKINISNYEQYVLDYYENNLNSRLKAEFEEFLLQNPQIKAEIDELIYLEKPDTEFFEFKAQLKKSAIEQIPYIDFLFISKIENTITEQQNSDLSHLMEQNPQLLDELNLYKKTKLVPEQVVFSDKQDLKHSKIISLNFLNVMKVAASIAVVVAFFFIFNRKNQNNYQIAVKSDIIAIKHKAFLQNNSIIAENLKSTGINQIKQVNVLPDSTTIYPQTNNLVASENIEPKNINMELSNIENKPDSKILTSQNCGQMCYNQSIPKPSNTFKPEDLVNFVLRGASVITESDKYFQIEINRKRKSYGLEVNDKVYRVVLK